MGADSMVPVVVLPGMHGTADLLTEFVARLSASRAVHVVSYPPDQVLSYRDLTEFVLRRVEARRFVIIEESFSGPIAIEIAASDPRVAGLVLASSFARHPLPSFLIPLARAVNLSVIPTANLIALLLGRTRSRELEIRTRHVLGGLNPSIMCNRAVEALRVDKSDELRRVTCPVLCLHGRFDRLITTGNVAAIHRLQPHCRVEWFDTGHVVLEAQPDLAATAINQFCDDVP